MVPILLLITTINVASSFRIDSRHHPRLPAFQRIENAKDRLLFMSNNDRNENDENVQINLNEKINQFLDSPFFDPDELLENGNDGTPIGRFQTWFATLLQADYEFAETLYVGLLFSFLVWITQELLRMQLYGDNYVPFTPGGRY